MLGPAEEVVEVEALLHSSNGSLSLRLSATEVNVCTVGCAVVTVLLVCCVIIVVLMFDELRLLCEDTTDPIAVAEPAELDTATDGVLLTGGCCFFLKESLKQTEHNPSVAGFP